MTLTEYLTTNSIKRTDFAITIGVSQSYVTMLCQGEIWPGRDIVKRIVDATSGQVTPNDFIDRPAAPGSDEVAA